MAGQITAFGYAVPITVVLVALALVVGLALAVSFYLTVGWSVYRSVRDTRRDRVREEVRGELLARLFGDDPEWEPWVAGLSGVEREVVESLLDDHLRELDGSDAERLRELGDALAVPARAGRRLARGDEFERLHALTWLTLLRRPDPYLAADFEPRTVRERAAAARLCIETGAAPPAAAVEILLADGDEELPVFGQDTLYRAAREAPEAFLSTASANYGTWPTALLVQTLAVAGRLDTSVRTGELAWLTAALEAEEPAVRAAAARALGGFGWRRPLRDRVFLERATADPSPEVRAAVYGMLADWGDEMAVSVLMYALVSETDRRALLRGTRALVTHADVGDEVGRVFGDAWTWSSEHAAYDRRAVGGTEPLVS